jgi:nucleoside-diphosphate-sugar epimerase
MSSPMSDSVLVTGASGFIGRPLSEALERAGCTVIRHSASDGDIANCALTDNSVKHVYHLAARTFVPDSWSDPLSFYATNVLGTVNVAEFCRRHSASLTMLSSYVYGKPRFLPISEEHPIAAFNPYGHTKLLAEEVCRYYAQQFGIQVTIIRPFNVYGPGQAGSFLIPTLLRQALDPGVSEVSLADDRPRRDYIFIDDLIDLLLLTMKPEGGSTCGFDAFNAGSGSSVNPRELAELILRLADVEKRVVSRGEVRADEVLDTVADIGKAGRIFGWEPRVLLVEGLGRMLEEASADIRRSGGAHS